MRHVERRLDLAKNLEVVRMLVLVPRPQVWRKRSRSNHRPMMYQTAWMRSPRWTRGYTQAERPDCSIFASAASGMRDQREQLAVAAVSGHICLSRAERFVVRRSKTSITQRQDPSTRSSIHHVGTLLTETVGLQCPDSAFVADRDRFHARDPAERAIAMGHSESWPRATSRSGRGAHFRGALPATAEVAHAAPATAPRPERSCCARRRRCSECPEAVTANGPWIMKP